ncbi:hypothetical protein ACH5Y9_06720 [Methylomonas sp. BW4-1]|uniref:hypothetical protein n=1 Tax=Methylomonas sp. BW4-1 TaxID=3376685 RepID=UPI0040432ED5
MNNKTSYIISIFISTLLSIYSQNSQSNTNQTENTLRTQAITDLRDINNKEEQRCNKSQSNSAIYNARPLNSTISPSENGKLCSPSIVKYNIPSQNSLSVMDEPGFSQPSNSSPTQQIASYCNTYYLSGYQYEICYTQEEIDEAFN